MVELENMVYLRDNRIYMAPTHEEYDITDSIQELIEKLEEIRSH